MKVALFGAGRLARKFCGCLPKNIRIEAIADNDYKQMGCIVGHKVVSPEVLPLVEFDRLIIAMDDMKEGNENEVIRIYQQVKDMKIPDDKIILQSFKYYFDHPKHIPRTQFVYSLGKFFEDNEIKGSVAECGVYRGWFAGVLSDVFPNSPLHLFDSFEGFYESDIEQDDPIARRWVFNGANQRLSNTSEDIVALRIWNRDRLHIHKGFIPETLKGVDGEFSFVNLDMDLFTPQLAALEFFSEKMVSGGVILMHDYFNTSLPGTKRAIEKFKNRNQYALAPIGDQISLALIRK